MDIITKEELLKAHRKHRMDQPSTFVSAAVTPSDEGSRYRGKKWTEQERDIQKRVGGFKEKLTYPDDEGDLWW